MTDTDELVREEPRATDTSELMFRSIPVGKLPVGLPGGVPNLEYDALYVLQILDTNPKQLGVSVKRLPPVAQQSALNQAHLNLATEAEEWSNPDDWPIDEEVQGKLHRRLRTENGALVVFHLVDEAASFIVDAGNSAGSAIMTADLDDPNILRRPMWVNDLDRAFSAVSVVLTRGELAKGEVEEHDYAIGINVVDQETGEITPIYIDPKIENDGGG